MLDAELTPRPWAPTARHWAWWVAAVGASFAVLEFAGYRHGVTLTAATREALGIDPRRPWCTAGQVAAVGIGTALVHHFVRQPLSTRGGERDAR